MALCGLNFWWIANLNLTDLIADLSWTCVDGWIRTMVWCGRVLSGNKWKIGALKRFKMGPSEKVGPSAKVGLSEKCSRVNKWARLKSWSGWNSGAEWKSRFQMKKCDPDQVWWFTSICTLMHCVPSTTKTFKSLLSPLKFLFASKVG